MWASPCLNSAFFKSVASKWVNHINCDGDVSVVEIDHDINNVVARYLDG